MKKVYYIVPSIVALISIVSCNKEVFEEFQHSGTIGLKVEMGENYGTKSQQQPVEALSQIIPLNDDYSIEEIISDDIAVKMDCAPVTKGYITTTYNIGDETLNGPKYIGMTGFIENTDELDDEYADTPNPYVNYGVASRNNDKNKTWTLVNPSSHDQYPWLWKVHYNFWSYSPVDGSGKVVIGPDDVPTKSYASLSFSKDLTDQYDKMTISNYVVYHGTEEGRGDYSLTYNDTKYHHDLIAAYTNRWYNDDNNNVEVPLTFKHALAAVRFNVGGVPNVTVKSICLSGVMAEGTCVVKATSKNTSAIGDTYALDFSWNTSGAPTSFWQSYVASDFIETAVADGVRDGDQKLDGEKIFFMIPQELTDAKIGVVFEYSDHSTAYIERPISTTWTAGKTYTYNIIFNGTNEWEYVISPIPDVTISYLGGNGTFDVYSYRQKISDPDVKQIVPWKLQYQLDNGTWTDVTAGNKIKSMLTMNAAAGTGALPTSTPETLAAVIDPSTSHPYSGGDAEVAHATVLKSRAVKGAAAAPYDLSYFNPATGAETAARNTANCYVVSAPGYYKIPLVYGNGVKNGYVNYSVMAKSKTDLTYDPQNPDPLKTFVGHDDLPIVDPYILASLTRELQPEDSYILWEDAENLISNVHAVQESYTNDIEKKQNAFIYFEVKPENIRQGNCLIAIHQEDGILWSWHIWVTDEDLSSTQALYDGDVAYDFMKFNLGWCSVGKVNGTQYDERAVKFRVIGIEGNKTAEFMAEQMEYIDAGTTTRGYNPFYQWGRKDPIIPGTGLKGEDHTVYNASGVISNYANNYLINGYSPSPATIGQSIKNPMKMFGNGSGAGDIPGDNLNMDDWCVGHYYTMPNKTVRQYWDNTARDWRDQYLNGCGFPNLWSAYCSVLEVPKYPLEGKNKTSEPKSLAQYSIPVAKTLYDPCPVGFSVPNVYAFMELISDKGAAFNTEYVGGTHNCRDGSIFFFPAVGYRGYGTGVAGVPNNCGQIVGFGTEANLWAGTSMTRQRASYASVSEEDTKFDMSVFFKTVGASIRPVKEKDVINITPNIVQWNDTPDDTNYHITLQ